MSFRKLWENMNASKDKKASSDVDEGAIAAIKTGLNVNETFWQDFILVLNNSEGLSALLDTPIEKIITWRKNIENAIAVVEEREGKIEFKKNKKLLKTGLPDDDEDEE